MDFSIGVFGVIRIGGIEFWITESLRNTWIIMGALILLAIIVRVRLKKWKNKDTPDTFTLQNVIEAVVEAFEGFAWNSAGPKVAASISGWFFMVFLFVLLSNISGIFSLRPPTADWTVTVTLALCTFFMIQYMGVKHQKGAYIKKFFQPFFLFLPMNIIGELARPISLSFRLFGNILAGVVMMSLLYQVAPVFIWFVVPVPVSAFFDVLFGVLQTFIFTVLGLSFIGAAATGDS